VLKTNRIIIEFNILKMNKIIIIILGVIISASYTGKNNKDSLLHEPKEKISTNISGKGPKITLKFFQGPSFNYPLIAIWLEDTTGKFIQTLYVSKTVVTRVFTYSRQEDNKWITSPVRATKTLPYWAHKRNADPSEDLYYPDEKSVVPDAYTGATPKAGFILSTRADNPLPGKFKVMLEINQKWDKNEYWTPNKYPGDEFYKMSYQPALVYEAIVEKGFPKKFYPLRIIGHSHYSGNTSELFTDLSTFTTALYIADSIIVRIKSK
jgi:hypothetical protein